jgi:hypothetical protein
MMEKALSNYSKFDLEVLNPIEVSDFEKKPRVLL